MNNYQFGMRYNPIDKMCYSALLLVIVIWGNPLTMMAQGDEGMLIFQVDGNQYNRKNFDSTNKLKSYQTIAVGKVNKADGKIETIMTVITYKPDGTQKNADQTNLVCTPDSRQVLMGIFPFGGGKSNQTLIVKMKSGGILYPSDWRNHSELKDFKFSMNILGGAAGFFGTRSEVSISNRKVMHLTNSFGVSGQLSMKAYVLGIRVSNIQYDFYEEIDEVEGIVYQKYTDSNGSYFTTEIIK